MSYTEREAKEKLCPATASHGEMWPCKGTECMAFIEAGSEWRPKPAPKEYEEVYRCGLVS
jgi:hypothetical protein